MTDRLTLLDLAIRTGNDKIVGIIDETIKSIPEISGRTEEGTTIPGVGSGRTIAGRTYKTLVRTGLPTTSFRNANDGTTPSKGTMENRTVETFILNPRWEIDKAIADNHEDGPESLLFDEGQAIVQSAMQLLGRQFFYGRTIDGAGHPGLVDSVQTEYTVNATGSGGDCSSVWGVRYGAQDVSWVWGVNGMLDVSTPRLGDIDGQNSKKLTGWIQELLAYPGLQVGSVYSLSRIYNIDPSFPLTDDMIYSLLSKLKEGKRPQVWFMTNRSREQLRASRTATNATGAPAPIPTEVAGIPIAVTESLTNAE